jgi:hypothetical protein
MRSWAISGFMLLKLGQDVKDWPLSTHSVRIDVGAGIDISPAVEKERGASKNRVRERCGGRLRPEG